MCKVMQTNPVSGKACSPTKGSLICFYMQPLLASQTTEFVICISIFIRDLLPSHYFPLREVSSRDLAWELHVHGCSGLKYDNVVYIHLTLFTIKVYLNLTSMHM